MTEHEVTKKLEGVPPGTEIFVSYRAGGPVSLRAEFEARKASDNGYNRRFLQGKLERVFTNKRGQLAVCLFTYTRYNLDRPEAEGHYRTFNPSVGQVLSLEVLS